MAVPACTGCSLRGLKKGGPVCAVLAFFCQAQTAAAVVPRSGHAWYREASALACLCTDPACSHWHWHPRTPHAQPRMCPAASSYAAGPGAMWFVSCLSACARPPSCRRSILLPSRTLLGRSCTLQRALHCVGCRVVERALMYAVRDRGRLSWRGGHALSACRCVVSTCVCVCACACMFTCFFFIDRQTDGQIDR